MFKCSKLAVLFKLTLGMLFVVLYRYLNCAVNWTMKAQRNVYSFQCTLLKGLAKCDCSYDNIEYYHKEELKLVLCQRV